ncbi:hypothetical protein ACFOLL_13190 [Falsochrobactrum ovis]|uniref:Uncharacterized protein n=1 Tax=Falsochrobactrum ovis TaxID=1293442 RepID=A0A364JVG1_9HYPH|nr:hypothetical protein [Falsochrobactrum ovis]RAK27056.1 hypothetical protein C7374_11150 [Falsochrobactrum ovis]RAK29104.1 hypothetical protein C7374_105155 [Falsochrobactrum ovis]
MTRPATIRKNDLKRYAEVANENGCKIIIRTGDTTITVVPDKPNSESSGIDYSRPVL